MARSGGTLLVRNSILAGNAAAGTNKDCTTNLTAGVTSEGYNLVGVADGCASSFVVTGDQTGTSGAPLDAALGALADNGGPTQTRALLAASPAIDGATPSGCDGWNPEMGFDVPLDTDQRGDTAAARRRPRRHRDLRHRCVRGCGRHRGLEHAHGLARRRRLGIGDQQPRGDRLPRRLQRDLSPRRRPSP